MGAANPATLTPEMQDRWEAAQQAYSRKIRTAARNAAYVSPDHDVEDMEQELWICLYDSCKLYDPDRGASFNSFFWMRAKQRIHQLATRAKTKSRTAVVVSLEEEGISTAVDSVLSKSSAEQQFFAQQEIQERGRGHLRGLAAYWKNREAQIKTSQRAS